MTFRRPLKINGTSGLIEMTDANLDYISYLIRVSWAGESNGPGHLTINSAPGGYSSIGAVTDQSRSVGRSQTNIGNVWGVAASNSNVAAPGTLSNVVYTMYQNYNSSTAEPADAAAWNLGPLIPKDANFNNLQPIGYIDGTKTLADVYDTIIDPTIQDVEGGGVGKFHLATAAPDVSYSSTGFTLANRQVTASNTGGPSTTTYTLYKKVSESAPTTSRPVMYNSTNAGFIEMTDAQIVTFFKPFLYNRVNEGNRLKYTFGTSSTGIDAGGSVETFYAGTTTASNSTLISGHTYYRDVTSLSTTNYYLRLSNT